MFKEHLRFTIIEDAIQCEIVSEKVKNDLVLEMSM